MEVYVVIIEDKHCDTEAEVFSSSEKAIEYARKTAKELCRFPEDFDEELNDAMIEAGWLYHAQYSCEGDSVWVYPTKLREE